MTETLSKSHYSGLTQHRKCPQAWQYRYIQKLVEVEDGVRPERDFGSWWHAVRAAWLLAKGRELNSLRYVPRKLSTVDDGPTFDPKTVTTEEVITAAEQWWSRRSAEVQDEWESKLGAPLAEGLDSMLRRWTARWADDHQTQAPLAVEMYWERDLPTPASPWDQNGAESIRLFGFIDEIYWDSERDLVVVRDGKTSKTLGTQTAVDDLMDSQLMLYAWGASPIVKEWGFGKIRAVAYDRARSVMPKPPTLTQTGRLSQRAGEPSLSACDLGTYLAWAQGPDGQGVPYSGRKKDGSDGGYYTAEESVIEKLSQPAAQSAWFQRTLTPLNMNVIRAHLRSAVDSAADIRVTEKRVAETGEAARNLGPSCKWCSYASLCRAQMIGGPEGDYPLDEYGLRKR